MAVSMNRSCRVAIAGLAAPLLAFGLAACGGGKTHAGTAGSEAPPAPAAPAPAAAAADERAAESPVADGPRPSATGDHKYVNLHPLDGYFATCTDWDTAYEPDNQWAVAALFLTYNGGWPAHPEDKLVNQYAADLDRSCKAALAAGDDKDERLLAYAEEVIAGSAKYKYPGAR